MPKINTCRCHRPLTAGAALLAMPSLAAAQTFPAKPIKRVVPFPPGGLIDTMARLVSTRLAQELGPPVVIDNKPGAGGNLGAAEMARSNADGYTLLMVSPPLTISPALYAAIPCKPDQITPVSLLGRVPNVLLVSSMKSRGAGVGFLNAQLMGAFMTAGVAKWKRVASFANITLG